MDRRKFLQSTATLGATVGLTLAAPPFIARAATKELLVAEPVHSTGYLPMYIAMANNYFAESDIAVKIVTIETGSGHTNAVLSGQASPSSADPSTMPSPRRRAPNCAPSCTASTAATSISALPRARIPRIRTGRLI